MYIDIRRRIRFIFKLHFKNKSYIFLFLDTLPENVGNDFGRHTLNKLKEKHVVLF